MKRQRTTLLLIFLFALPLTGFSRLSINPNFKTGFSWIEGSLYAFHGGAALDIAFLPYLGAYLGFDGYRYSDMWYSYTCIQDQKGHPVSATYSSDARGLRPSSYDQSVRVYSVGLNFEPLAIAWPNTKHHLAIRADVGFEMSYLQRWYYDFNPEEQHTV